MRIVRLQLAVLALAVLPWGTSWNARQVAAQEPAKLESTAEQIAAKIIATTVTVRATYNVADPNVPEPKQAPGGVGGLSGPPVVPPVAGPNLPAYQPPPNSAAANAAPNTATANSAPAVVPVPQVSNQTSNAEKSPAHAAATTSGRPARTGVAVASGVSLGHGMIATFVTAPGSARIRVTLPADGGSAEARPVVVDHYSGLTLLEIEQTNLPSLPLVEKTPPIGTAIYTAAGSGAEEPMVSRGILSGTPRAMGTLLPPVLPCDVRTTASSSGAPLVDSSGRLLGIVAGADSTGWAYAVPVQHVERLMKARPAQGVVVLERRQPVLGLNLRPGAAENPEQPPTVEVARVIPGGPSETAGMRVGDVVSEVDGKKVRILYDVSKIVLSKQPGDRVAFTIRRGDEEIPLSLTLGGAPERPTAIAKLEGQMIGVAQPFAGSQRSVQVPSLVVSSQSGASNVSVTLAPAERTPDRLMVGGPGGTNQVVPTDPNLVKPAAEIDRLRHQVAQMQADLERRDREVALLKLQLEGWAKALQAFQTRSQARDEAQDANAKMIKELEAEIERLRKAR